MEEATDSSPVQREFESHIRHPEQLHRVIRPPNPKGRTVALAERGTKEPQKTKFELWLDSLSDRNRTVVTGWLTDPYYSNMRVAEMIRDDDPDDDFSGYRATKDTIAAWRRANNVIG